MPMSLELTLFGSPEVRVNGKLISGFRSSKAQALLYYLAVTARAHARPTLAGLLWGDQPEDAARVSLSKCLSNLRDLLGDALLIERQTVAFNRNQPYHLDTEHFIADVAQPPTAATIPAWQAALAFYRGDFLEGFYVRDAPEFEQWVLVQRAHYREAVINGLHTLAGFYEQGGDLPSAITHTRRLLTLEPWREEAHRQLMTLLARSGQRAAALAQFETCRRILDEELAVEPDVETRALVEAIRAGEFDKVTRWQGDKVNPLPARPLTLSPPNPVVNNLPIPPTPLIGRERELTELGELINNPQCRLITILGPGGIGKTRLALAAASQQTNTFRHGVVFATLSAIANPDFLGHAILQALAQPLHGAQTPQMQLLTYLLDKQLLLILDNYEQLLPDVTLLLDILTQAAGVTLVVTSRERLALQAEHLFSLEGLTYPQQGGVGELDEFFAIQLFLQRVRQLHHHFVPTRDDLAATIRICQVAEGMPLALELAAAATRVQSISVIAEAMESQQRLLTVSLRDLPPRHHNMQTVFEHSWQLLTLPEQNTLARLSIFRGSFTVEAANHVTETALLLLVNLIDKSLLQRRGADSFEIHGLIRQFATTKLQAGGEFATIRQRHAAYFVGLAEDELCRLATTQLHPEFVMR